jgi:hypothetical protein
MSTQAKKRRKKTKPAKVERPKDLVWDGWKVLWTSTVGGKRTVLASAGAFEDMSKAIRWMKQARAWVKAGEK